MWKCWFNVGPASQTVAQLLRQHCKKVLCQASSRLLAEATIINLKLTELLQVNLKQHARYMWPKAGPAGLDVDLASNQH